MAPLPLLTALLWAGCAPHGGALVASPRTRRQRRLPRARTPALRTAASAAPAGDATSTAVVSALERLREDLERLDQDAASRPRVSVGEGAALGSAVAAAVAAPVSFPGLAELVVPASSLLIAAVGVAAEYGGRVATANAKEVAAVSLRTAAEAEAALAEAERHKAPVPLTVGAAAACSALSLAAPASGAFRRFLLAVAPAAACFAALAAQIAAARTVEAAARATNLGRRRFATREDVGRTWRSQTEMVFAGDAAAARRWYRRAERERRRPFESRRRNARHLLSSRRLQRWTLARGKTRRQIRAVVRTPRSALARGALPAPAAALFCPGGFGFRAVLATAVAAFQTAYHLTKAELAVARATDAVADKARTAAIIDAYANQAARVGALLPFTSALAGLCAAAAAAAVEVAPIAAAVFPVLGAVCAAAASVSKACCEADASAAAASTEQLSSADADDAPGVYRALLATARDALRGRPGDLG